MPGGTWNFGDVTSAQTRPGAYFNLIAQAFAALESGNTGTVLVVGRADWGPVDSVVEITSEGAADLAYGSGLSMSKLIKQALRGGAAVVKGLRIAGSSAAEASATLNDGVAAAALDVEALYPGSRANNFTITVAAHPVSGKTLELRESGVLLESFHAAAGENDEFAAAINGSSSLISAAVNGVADRVVADVADSPLSTGNSGGTVVAGDYTAAQSLAESIAFDVMVQDDDATDANQDAAAVWAAGRRDAGQLFILVMGSATADTVSTAMTRAAAQDNEGVVYVHPGFTDDDGVVYSGQEAAARVAGLIASSGITKSITFSELSDVASVEQTLTTAQIGLALEAGVTLIVADNSGVARVEKGINTYTSFAADNKSKAFTKIRTVATMDALVEGLEAGFKAYIGNTTNDEDGRKSLLGAGKAFLDELERARAIKPGSSIALDDSVAAAADQVFVRVGVTPLDSIEQIFTTVYVSE